MHQNVQARGRGGGGNCPPTIAGFSTMGQFNGHAYYLSDVGATWQEAVSLAQMAGGYLTAISSQAENVFIKSHLGHEMVFIGLSDQDSEGHPAWANGEPLSFDLSYNNTPDGDYAVMNFWAGTWDMNYDSWVVKRFVMEMDCANAQPDPGLPHARTRLTGIYPNPANDLITARILSSGDETVRLHIYNASGALMASRKTALYRGMNEITWEIAGLPAGMYFIRCTGRSTESVWRFVKTD